MHMSGRSDSPFKTVIHSNSLGFSGDASASNRGPAPVLPPTAGPSGPFATHNSSFNTALGPFASQTSQASHNQTSFRTLIDEPAPGVPRMNSQGPQIPQSAHQGGPFSSFHSQGSAGFAQQSMPRGPMMGPMGAMISQDGPPQGPPPVDSDLGVHCTVVVSKLLDVPVESGMFVKDAKTYQLRVMDHKRKELVRSEEIQGLEDSQLHGLTTQTFSIPEELGTLHAKTLSKTIQVQVEFTGLMGATIGTCQINRLDFRSSKPWPYEVTSDNKVVCGIELCVVEDEPLVSSPMLYSSGMGMMQLHQVMSDKDVEDVQHNLSCELLLHSAKDLPAPRTPEMKDVVLTIMSSESGKELRKIGLFQSDVPSGNQLASVDFKETRAFVRDRMYWGGDAQDGAQYIKIAISYGKRSGNATSTEIIGVTDPIKVSWKEEKEYIKLWNPDNRRLLGGIYLSYRLVTEAEAVADGTMKSGRVALPQITAPVELERRVSGRTGNFAPGSAEEAIEQAVINAEAQNRALLQRCKKEDSNSPHDFPGMRVNNGWREWDNLDALFESMGPNPLVMSEDLGPQVARGYQHSSNIARDVAKYLPAAKSPADQMLNLEMLRMYVKDDVGKGQSMIRPVVCKDANEITGPPDMTWCPDPPVYVPMTNLTEKDKETVRLACYKPEQNSSLLFVDANPNYNIREDIWGALHPEKTKYKHLQSLAPTHGRVKDDCIMS